MKINNRILIVDDNEDVHEDFKKILGKPKLEGEIVLDALEERLFDDAKPLRSKEIYYELDSAFHANDAYKILKAAEDNERPYAVMFIDVRMPPGMDGVEFVSKVWREFPHMEIVIVTAYSDYSWDDILEKVGSCNRLLFVRKPFDLITIKQMALTLSKKWTLSFLARTRIERIESELSQQTTRLSKMVAELKEVVYEFQALE